VKELKVSAGAVYYLKKTRREFQLQESHTYNEFIIKT